MNQSSVVEKLRKISTDNPGQRYTRLKFLAQKKKKTSSQVPSYASPKLLPSDLLTGVKCRATSVAKKRRLPFLRKLILFRGIYTFWY